MASNQNINERVGKLICINNINAATMTQEEKEELKTRIQLTLSLMQRGGA